MLHKTEMKELESTSLVSFTYLLRAHTIRNFKILYLDKIGKKVNPEAIIAWSFQTENLKEKKLESTMEDQRELFEHFTRESYIEGDHKKSKTVTKD